MRPLPFAQTLRMREATCIFCNPDRLEEGVGMSFRDMYIIVTRPSEELVHGRALTACDCMFVTHSTCWLSYCDSKTYNGCPICKKEIPSVKRSRFYGVLSTMKYEKIKQTAWFLLRISLYLGILFFLCLYLFHEYRQSKSLREQQ